MDISLTYIRNGIDMEIHFKSLIKPNNSIDYLVGNKEWGGWV